MAHTYIHAKDSTGAVHPVLVKSNGELVLDGLESGINQIKDNTSLVHGRLSNIQDWVGTQDGAGGGTKTGVMIDSCASSLNTVESNSTLTASRLNNIQNAIASAPLGSQANLMDGASCLAAGTTSSVIDWGTASPPRRIMVGVTATASVAASGFEIWWSHDNTTWVVLINPNGSKTVSMSTTNTVGGAINTTGSITSRWSGARYMKIIVYSLGTYTATVIGSL